MEKIANLSELERVLDYPYDAPDYAYLIKNGLVFFECPCGHFHGVPHRTIGGS